MATSPLAADLRGSGTLTVDSLRYRLMMQADLRGTATLTAALQARVATLQADLRATFTQTEALRARARLHSHLRGDGALWLSTPYRDHWHPQPGLDPDYYADLPAVHARDGLLANPPEAGSPAEAVGQSFGEGHPNCGWHGTAVDSDRGFYAVVRSDGPLAWWYGKVVRITFYSDPNVPRQVVVYVHGLIDDLFEDVSLSRRAFLSLANLAREEIAVVGEVIE
jgi:hypothetical protein